MNSYFDFSSDDFFIGTTYRKESISDKDNFLSIIDGKKLNRRYISNAVQIHSNKVLYITNPGTYNNLDGLIAHGDSKLILVMRTADCIPMFVFDSVNKNYGIIHAGWKGIHNKIHLNVIYELSKLGSNISHLSVIMGPSIKSCCYEIGKEMKEIFHSKYITNKDSKYYLDLNQCIVSDLEKIGIQNINIDQTCSYEEKKCYSYRKNDSVGRMYSFITLY